MKKQKYYANVLNYIFSHFIYSLVIDNMIIFFVLFV